MTYSFTHVHTDLHFLNNIHNIDHFLFGIYRHSIKGPRSPVTWTSIITLTYVYITMHAYQMDDPWKSTWISMDNILDCPMDKPPGWGTFARAQ